LRLNPARRYVNLTQTRFSRIADLAVAAEDPEIDLQEGTVFAPGQMYLTSGRMQDNAPWRSDYRHLHIYCQSIPARRTDYLSAADYLWRWDTDWFWCSRQFHAQNPLVRFLATPRLLNSRTYQRLMRLSNEWLPASSKTESVIQDVSIPLRNAPAFLDFLLSEIRITPIWLCPFRTSVTTVYPLWPLEPNTLYVNFGFWDVLPAGREPGYFNRTIEHLTRELDGRKALYSSSFYDPEAFALLYDRQRYETVKHRCDPDGLFGDLYSKCVQKR
jgi:hypothetical protein